MVYGFGRRLPTWMQIALAWQVRMPAVRRLLAERRVEDPPVCGWTHWQHIEEEVRRRTRLAQLSWVHFRSQWGKERSSMLGLDGDGAPRVFVVVEPPNRETLTDRLAGDSFIPGRHMRRFVLRRPLVGALVRTASPLAQAGSLGRVEDSASL